MRKKNLILMMLFQAASVVTFGQHGSQTVDVKARERWIRQNAAELKHDKILGATVEVQPDITDVPGYRAVSYRISSKSLIRCGNGEWLVILPHSSHQDTLTGDVSIAVTSRGEIQVNYSHICGGIIHFKSHDASIPQSANDFFARFPADGDTETASWTKWRRRSK